MVVLPIAELARASAQNLLRLLELAQVCKGSADFREVLVISVIISRICFLFPSRLPSLESKGLTNNCYLAPFRLFPLETKGLTGLCCLAGCPDI